MDGYVLLPIVFFAFFVILAIYISGAAMRDLEARLEK